MSLTPSARPNRREENFSSTRRTSCLETRNQRFWAQEAEMSLTTPSARSNRREENFSCTRRTPCPESRNQTFLGSGGRKRV